MDTTLGWLLAILVSLVHSFGIFSAFHAVLNARTASGAIAWSISLVTFPYLTLPIYWAFSREKFYGYVKLLRATTLAHDRYRQVEEFFEQLEPFGISPDPSIRKSVSVYEQLARLPFTSKNRVDLLIDGQETFDSMFEAIEQAVDYVLIYFYIIADDEIGNELKSHLLAKAEQGVRVYFMYDELGCMTFLSNSYVQELRQGGVEAHPFYTTRGSLNKLQYNFRNHRKITVVDGRVAFVGGVNVHDDSLGLNPFYGPWRDTHARLEGPAVQGVQLVFAEDYFYATGKLPVFNWTPQAAPDGHDRAALYLGSGPASILDAGILFFVQCINAATDRLWVASPYFVPDPSVVDALILASLRGVDVRIILPEKYDLLVMYLAAFSYLPEFENTDVRLFRYRAGHPHQKVMLIDDKIAWVGSANMDNRSMRLNFEGTLVVLGEEFAGEVEEMLLEDLSHCVEVGAEDYYHRSIAFKLGVQFARLLSPVL